MFILLFPVFHSLKIVVDKQGGIFSNPVNSSNRNDIFSNISEVVSPQTIVYLTHSTVFAKYTLSWKESRHRGMIFLISTPLTNVCHHKSWGISVLCFSLSYKAQYFLKEAFHREKVDLLLNLCRRRITSWVLLVSISNLSERMICSLPSSERFCVFLFF